MNLNESNLKNREQFEQLLLQFLTPLKHYYSKENAQLNLGVNAAVYDRSAAWTEGFSRPLWGLVPYWAGGSREGTFESIYLKGLAAGTDPSNPEYWGGFTDVDQRFVEMAAIAYAILITPEVIWEPLSSKERTQLAQWLNGINHHECPPCNWMFFGILVNIALKSKNQPYSPECLAAYLDYIESCYEGNGWYIDGQNGEKDYYISFAFHYYGLLYARFMKKEDPERSLIYRQRAAEFAKDFIYWFADDGSALAYGRSLTYRFAQVSFFSMCAASELEVFPYPVMKGLIIRHLSYWIKQPIFDHAGILTIGYGYPNLLMSEQYNAPGSPYWCMKSFAFLSLSADHPFWTVEPARLPDLEPIKIVSNNTMLIQRLYGRVTSYATGRTLPHHHIHTEEKYSKFAYSSKFSFSVPRSQRSIEEAAPDSMLAFLIDGIVFTRSVTGYSSIEGQTIAMEWSPCNGIQVKTRICLSEHGHRRTHAIDSNRICTVYDCGFAIPTDDSSEQSVLIDGNYLKLLFGRDSYSVKGSGGEATIIHASPNTNLTSPKTIIPCVKYSIETGTQKIETEFLEYQI